MLGAVCIDGSTQEIEGVEMEPEIYVLALQVWLATPFVANMLEDVQYVRLRY